MEFERLPELWRQQREPGTSRSPKDALAAVRREAVALERTIRNRDRLECGIALVMLPIFAWLTFAARHDISRIGAAIIALGCLLIPVRLHLAREPMSTDPGQPLTLALAQELARVRAQQRLLASVAWWYFGPLGLGVVLFVAGGLASAWLKAGFTLVIVLFYGWLWRLNQAANRSQLAPRARQLESWLASLGELERGSTSSEGAR